MAVNIPVQVVLDAIDNASGKISSVSKSFTDMDSDVKQLATSLVGVGAATGFLAKGFIEQAGAMEQNMTSFEVMLGSASKAKALMDELVQFAKTTPFTLPGIVEGAKQLLAYGFEQKEVIKTSTMLGDVASGLKIPFGDIVYLYGTLRAQGRAYTKDLNQFTARGIPILDQLAKQFGVSTEEVFKLTEAGKVGFPEINKAFVEMTKEGATFHNLMDKQSKTTMGRWSNMQDAIIQLQIALGDALLPVVNQLIDTMLPLLEQFKKWSQQNPELVKNLVAAGLALGAIGATMLILGPIVSTIAGSFKILLGTFKLLTGGFGLAAKGVGLMVTALGGPLTLIIFAILAAITLLYFAWTNNWGDIQGKTAATVEFLKGLFEGLKNGISAFVSGAAQLWNGFIAAMIGAGVAIQNAWNGLVLFITNIPAMITTFIALLTATLINFFLITLPFALGFAVGWLVSFFTVDLPNAFMIAVEFVTVTLPAAIGSMIAWLGQAIPAMAAAFVKWIKDMASASWAAIIQFKDNAIASLSNMKDNAIRLAIELAKGVILWIVNTKNDVTDTVNNLPGIISKAFNNAKETAIRVAKEIYEGVTGWLGKVLSMLGEIINKAGEALSKASQAFNSGFGSGQKRQYGGPVSAGSTYLVGEAGPELFKPASAGTIVPNNRLGGGGSAGATVQFIINANMIINSPAERRQIAEVLYKDLVALAKSHGTSVADLLGA